MQRYAGVSGIERLNSVYFQGMPWDEHELLMKYGCRREVVLRYGARDLVGEKSPCATACTTGRKVKILN